MEGFRFGDISRQARHKRRNPSSSSRTRFGTHVPAHPEPIAHAPHGRTHADRSAASRWLAPCFAARWVPKRVRDDGKGSAKARPLAQASTPTAAAPKREMGPALRLTPLSPACGPHRSGKLDAWRFNAVFVPLRRACRNRPIIARRSRRRRFRRDWVRSEDPSLSPGGSETGRSTRASISLASPVGSTRPKPEPERPACATLRLRGLIGPGSGPLQDESRCDPRLVPPPRGISPSRRSGA